MKIPLKYNGIKIPSIVKKQIKQEMAKDQNFEKYFKLDMEKFKDKKERYNIVQQYLEEYLGKIILDEMEDRILSEEEGDFWNNYFERQGNGYECVFEKNVSCEDEQLEIVVWRWREEGEEYAFYHGIISKREKDKIWLLKNFGIMRS